MECKGYIRVLKRNGENGSRCPVMGKCIIGAALNCDMRINLKGVASEHCKIFVDGTGRGIIENLTAQCPTLLNGSSLRLGQKQKLRHGDLFTVSDRTFRWEYLATSPFFLQSLQNELTSLESPASKKIVTAPFASLHHTPSANRIAVVTPVRREDSTPIDNKIERLKKSSIPVKKFYRHSIQGSETLFKKKSASRRSCAPNLVGTTVAKKLQPGSPAAASPLSYSTTSRKSKFFGIVQEMDVVDSTEEIKKSSRKSILPNTPAKGKKSIGKKSFVHVPEVSRTPSRKSIKDQMKVESMDVSPESQSSGKESTKKGRKSVKNVSNSNNQAADQMLLQRITKVDSEGADKKTVFKSRLKTPKKRVLETPGSVQQNAKRLKLTPNVASNESQLTPSTRGRSSASKAVKKPLFSEMVKKNASVIRKRTLLVKNAGKSVHMKVVRTKLQQPSSIPARLKVNSTGHAESPETIVIRKKVGTPRSTSKRKSFSGKVNRKSLRKSTSVNHNTKEKQTPVSNSLSKDKTPLRLSRASGGNTPGTAQFLQEKTALQATEILPSNSGKFFETDTPNLLRTSKGSKRLSTRVLVSSVKHTPLKKKRSSASKKNSVKKSTIFDDEAGLNESKTATPKGKSTPQSKSVTPKVKPTPQSKGTPKGETTPQPNVAILKEKPNLQKGATPKSKRTPQPKATTPKSRPTPQPKVATPKNRSTPQPKAATPKSKPTPQPKVATPKSKSTPQSKVATRKSKATPQSKVATPKSKTTPQSKVATPKSKATPQAKLVTPKRKSTERKAVSPKNKQILKSTHRMSDTPKTKPILQPKTVTPRSRTTPQQSAASPTRKASPQIRAITPKSKATQRKSVTPKNKQTQWKPVTPKSRTTPQSRAVTPKRTSTPQSRAVTPKKTSTPQSRAVTPKKTSTPQTRAATPKNEATSQPKAVTPKTIKTPQSVPVTPNSKPTPKGKSAKGKQMTQPKALTPKGKQTPQSKDSTPVTPKERSSRTVLVKDIRVSTGKLAAVRGSRSSRSKGTPVRENRLSVGKMTPNASIVSVERPTPKAIASSLKQSPLREIKTLTTERTPAKDRRASSAKKTSAREGLSPSGNFTAVGQSMIPSGKQTPVQENSLSPSKRSSRVLNSSSKEKRTPVRLASILSPPLQLLSSTGHSSSKKRSATDDEQVHLSRKKRTRSSAIASPDVFSPRGSSFDFSSIKTPQIPQETFVSPLSSRVTPNTSKSMDSSLKFLSSEQVVQKSGGRKSVKNIPRKSVKNLLNASKFTPSKELSDLSDIMVMSANNVSLDNSSHEKLPYPGDLGKSSDKPSKILKAKDIKHSLRSPGRHSTPRKNLGRISVLKTPKSQRSSKIKSVGSQHSAIPSALEENFQSLETSELGSKKRSRMAKGQKSPRNDLSDIEGVKKLLRTPKSQKSPKNDLNDVKGIKKLLTTPKVQKSPKNDLRDIRGVKELLASPKIQKSPINDLRDVRGVKKLLASPKIQKSPRNDLRDVRGVKKLLASPKIQKSPRNDLRDVRGVKKLLASPKIQKSPRNDLRDVRGVKKLLASPKIQKSPRNDLRDVRGVKKLLASPKIQKSPRNDLRDVRGVKKLLASPKIQKSPRNDLTNVKDVKQIFMSPRVQKSPKNDLTNVSGLKNLFDLSDEEKNLMNRTPHGIEGVPSSAKSSRKKTVVSEVVERTTRSRRKIDVQSPASSPKMNRIEKTPVVLASDDVPSPKKLRKTAKSNDNLTRNVDASDNSASKKVIAEVHDKIEENLTPNQKGRSRNTRGIKRSAEVVAIDSQSSDLHVTPPKTRRTRKNTDKEENESRSKQQTSDITSVSVKSSITPPRTRHGKNKSVAPERSATRNRNVSESSSAASPATLKSAEVHGSSFPKKSPSKTRARTKSISPAFDSLTEAESRSQVKKSPKATRGRTKSIVAHISEQKENISEESAPPSVMELERSTRNKKIRGRTKPSAVSSPVKDASPVPKSSPKGRRGKRNQSKPSAASEETLLQVNNIEVKSALASPQKKQTRSRKGETKTVKFHESVASAPEIQSEKISNKRSRVKEEDIKEIPEKQSDIGSKKVSATRATRSRKTNLDATETVDENISENVRATRSTRRKKT